MIGYLKNNCKGLLLVSMVLVMLIGAVGSVSAAEFPKGETLPAGETIDDDVFISGENVVIDGTINGMLFAGGTTITLNGTVSGDVLLVGETVVVSDSAVIDGNLLIAGANLTVNGQITGSIFSGSSALKIGSSATIGRNVYYGGFSINALQGSQIGKDLFVGSYQAILSGSVERDLKFSGAAVDLSGKIGRDAILNVGTVEEASQADSWMQFNPYIARYVETTIQPGIRVSDSASIGGDLTYTSSIDITSNMREVTSGVVVYQTPIPYETRETQINGDVKNFSERSVTGKLLGAAALNSVRNFLKLVMIGALALWLLIQPFKKLTDAAYAEPMKAIGWGFVLIAIGFMAIFILPVVFILIGVLLGFLSLGSLLFFWFGLAGTVLLFAVMLFFFIMFTLSKVLAAFLFGKWLMKAVFKQQVEKPWLSLLLGVFLYVLINAIPVLGWLAAFTATLFGTGAFWLAYLQKKTM